MNTTKLKEALAELQAQRNVLDIAIADIQKVLALLGTSVEEPREGKKSGSGKKSYIDDVEAVLELSGRPMHINDLVLKISEMRNAKIARASVESSLARHIGKVKPPRVLRVKPSTYGLPAWSTPVLLVDDKTALAS